MDEGHRSALKMMCNFALLINFILKTLLPLLFCLCICSIYILYCRNLDSPFLFLVQLLLKYTLLICSMGVFASECSFPACE